jgi:anthranilate phosphoribosyltransferase
VLDGSVTDLEIGAFCLAMRIKGETPEEMAGFLDATHQRLAKLLPASAAPGRAAQLQRRPQAAGADPAAGLLLAREGLPVLLHGMRTEARRILASDVLEALDIKALAAPEIIANGRWHTSTPSTCTPAWRACWPCARWWACATRGTAWSS